MHEVNVGVPVLPLECTAIPLRRTGPPSAVLAIQGSCRSRGIEPTTALDKRLVTPVIGRREYEIPELLRSGIVT